MPQTTGKSFRRAVVSVIDGLPSPGKSIVRRVRFQLKVQEPIRLAEFCALFNMERSEASAALGKALKEFHQRCQRHRDIQEWAKHQGCNLENQSIVFWLLGKDD